MVRVHCEYCGKSVDKDQAQVCAEILPNLGMGDRNDIISAKQNNRLGEYTGLLESAKLHLEAIADPEVPPALEDGDTTDQTENNTEQNPSSNTSGRLRGADGKFLPKGIE